MPPLRLIDLVSGQPDIPWFLEGGELGARTVRDALDRQGVDIESVSSFLDFGCGCGRVVRHWAELTETKVFGSDLNPKLIDWCRQNLAFGRFESNGLEPPLAFDDESMELVYAFSVFTHLPERLQRPWIEELARVLKPSGVLIISTHGERYRGELDAADRARFDAGQLVVVEAEDAGSNACGAYHPANYVRTELAAGLEVVEHVPEGAKGNPHQDLWVARKKSR